MSLPGLSYRLQDPALCISPCSSWCLLKFGDTDRTFLSWGGYNLVLGCLFLIVVRSLSSRSLPFEVMGIVSPMDPHYVTFRAIRICCETGFPVRIFEALSKLSRVIWIYLPGLLSPREFSPHVLEETRIKCLAFSVGVPVYGIYRREVRKILEPFY